MKRSATLAAAVLAVVQVTACSPSPMGPSASAEGVRVSPGAAMPSFETAASDTITTAQTERGGNVFGSGT